MCRQESRGEQSAERVEKLQHDAEEAAEFIASHVVQATMNERGNLGQHGLQDRWQGERGGRHGCVGEKTWDASCAWSACHGSP